MPPLTAPELTWIVDGLLTALVGGLVLALIVGLLLLAAPARLFALNALLSRSVDTSGSLRRLEKPMQVERFFYRHHRAVGALIMLGAAYVLWRWAYTFDRDAFLNVLGRPWVTSLDWLIRALETIVVLLHVLILVAGGVILFRPSLLKGVERTANRWHDGLPSDRLDAVVATVDHGVGVHPRMSGLVLVAASAWCLAALLPVLLQTLSR